MLWLLIAAGVFAFCDAAETVQIGKYFNNVYSELARKIDLEAFCDDPDGFIAALERDK